MTIFLRKMTFILRKMTIFLRKMRELLLALDMEKRMSKDAILALYLNVVEFGPGIHGIAEASDAWFLKDPAHLTPREAAFLVSILPAPNMWHSGDTMSLWVLRCTCICHIILGHNEHIHVAIGHDQSSMYGTVEP